MNIKKFFGRTLSALVLGLAGCMPHYSPANIKQPISLEQKVSKPRRSITFNYRTESEGKGINYLTSRAVFSQYSGVLDYFPNVLQLSSAGIDQVENLINDVKFGKIDSYQSLVGVAENLSEDQKLVLLGAIGGLLGKFNYDYDLPRSEVASQDIFFNKLQNSLETGNHNDLGICGHFSSHIEQLANDLGLGAAAVTGISRKVEHAYSIVNTKSGCVVIDFYDILTTNTNNIEKVLEAYQKWRGLTVFEHSFYEGTDFKYRLITRDGKHFWDFIDYDKSSKPLKDALFNLDKDETIITFNQGDSLDSLEFNHQGFFIKAGNISGSSFSPLEKMKLLQTGYKGKFSTSNTDVSGMWSLVYGKLYQDKELEINQALGVACDVIASTKNEDTFNFGFRMAGDVFSMGSIVLAYDFTTGVGTSYNFTTETSNIEPYITLQYSLFPRKIASFELGMIFNELDIGTRVDIKTPNGANFLIEPYYIKRMWEKGFGTNIGFGNRNFKLNLGGYTTRSNYEFCPHKNALNVGVDVTLKNLGIGLSYKREKVDYGGEKEDQGLLGFKVSTKF